MKDGDHFYMPSRARASEPFLYKGCGLDGIYLLNGFTKRDTKYGPTVSIEKMDQLHVAIGLHVVLNRKALSPKEIRFLRKQMDLTQNELGGLMRISGQQIARYEKAENEIPGPVDGLIRILYILSLVPEAKRDEFLQRVHDGFAEHEDVDEVSASPAYFESSSRGWNDVEVAAAFQ